MNSECLRIANQLRQAFDGDPWHGPPLRRLLNGVTPGQARARPLEAAHSVWELVLHIELYLSVALDAARGTPMPRLFETGKDWPEVAGGDEAWTAVTERFFTKAEDLARAIEGFSDRRLQDTAPGREYDYYYLFHGVVQHSLYHGGQIAILKKAAPAA
jgi:hypothetical protein